MMPTLIPAKPRPPRRSRGVLLLVAGALVTGTFSLDALAQAADRASPQSASHEARAVLVVIVDPGASGIDPTAVRDAIARELRVTVVDTAVEAGLGTLDVKIEASGALVRFQDAERKRTVERGVELPDTAEGAIDVIALLAGNLARDEARELVDALRADDAARRSAEQSAKEPSGGPRAASPATEGDAGRGPAPALPRSPNSAGATPSSRTQPVMRGASSQDLEAIEGYDARALRGFEAALWSPVGLDPLAAEHRFIGAFSLVYGRVGGIFGVGLSLGYEEVAGNARGVLVGTFATRVQGLTQGARISGLASFSKGPLRGFDGAGLVNLRASSVDGCQLSGLLNTADSALGAQIALVNVARGELVGAQLGGVNVVTSSASGLQVSGIYNRVRDLRGVQIGLVNSARDVRGLQLGLVNVAREMRGAAIGLVSVSRNGGVRAVVWHDRGAEANLGVKLRSGIVYTELGWGGDATEPLHAFSAGIGVHLGGRLSLEIDGVYRSEWDFRRSTENDGHAVHQRVKLGYEVIPRHLALFGGTGLRESLSPDGKLRRYEPLSVIGLEVF